jgi:hypothetical protein
MSFLDSLGKLIWNFMWSLIILLVVGSCSMTMVCNDDGNKTKPKICKMWFEEK